MSIIEILQKHLGKEQYESVGEKIKNDVSKIMVPKEDFNKAKADKETLEAQIETLKEAKTKLENDVIEAEKKATEKADEKLSELEKLQKSVETLTETLNSEKEARTTLEKTLEGEKRKSALHQLYQDQEIDLNPNYYDYADILLREAKVEEAKDRLLEIAKTKPEMFGKTTVAGKTPKGTEGETGRGLFTQEQVSKMSDTELMENYEKVKESEKTWS